jgi:hypothetical protein
MPDVPTGARGYNRGSPLLPTPGGLAMTSPTSEVPTLDAYRSLDGRTLHVWCQYCRVWHEHSAHAASPDCHLTSTGRPSCTCPPGSGDGGRVAHCPLAVAVPTGATRAPGRPATCSTRSARSPRRSSAPRRSRPRPPGTLWPAEGGAGQHVLGVDRHDPRAVRSFVSRA